MLTWRFAAANAALESPVGERVNGVLRVRAGRGCALEGPRVEMPAGQITARVHLAGTPRGAVLMEITSEGGDRVHATSTFALGLLETRVLELPARLDMAVSDLEVRLTCRLGLACEIVLVEIALERDAAREPLLPDRPVGRESSKTYADKIASGFFDRYLSGPNVMEVGYVGYDGATVPIVPGAIGIDVGYAGYDGSSFPFADGSFDAIYSSHCFEHIDPWKEVLRDWHRLLRIGGHLIIVVPHQHLFERKRHLPSYFNGDHKRYYTARSLLAELEEAFDENSYRVRHLVENDKGFNYEPPPREGTDGCYEIELVVEKIVRPYWTLDDGQVRSYPAGDFRTSLPAQDAWTIPLAPAEPYRCLIWGPYITLPAAPFVAEFHFDPIDDPNGLPDLVLDVGRNGDQLVYHGLGGPGGRAGLASGRIALPFVNDIPDASFEFRVYTAAKTGTKWPVFRGVVLTYDRAAASVSR